MARDTFSGEVKIRKVKGGMVADVIGLPVNQTPTPTAKNKDVLLVGTTPGFVLAETEEYGQVALTCGITVLKEEYERVTGKTARKSSNKKGNGASSSETDKEKLLRKLMDLLGD